MPNDVKEALASVLSTSIGDMIKEYGSSITVALSEHIENAFQVSDGIIFISTDVDAFVELKKEHGVSGD